MAKKLQKILSSLKALVSDKNGFLSLIDQGIVSAANFISGVIIGRSCSEEQFGLYMLAFTIITFSMNCQGSLITTPYTIYRHRMSDDDILQYTGSTIIHQFLYTFLIIILLVVASIFISYGFGPSGMADVIKMLFWVIGFILFWDCIRRINFAAFNVRAALIQDICIALIQICVLYFLSQSGWLSAASGVAAIGGGCAFIVLLWIFLNRKLFKVLLTRVVNDFLKNFTTGRWIFASVLLWTLGSSIPPWLVAEFHGVKITGIWAACVGVSRLCNPLLIGLQNYFRPKIAYAFRSGNVEELRKTCLVSTGVFGLLIAPFFLILLIFGGDLVSLFYGDKYSGNGFIISLMGLNLLLSGLTFPPSRALFTIGRADIDFKLNLVLLILLCTFGSFLIYKYDLVGACVALVINNFVSFIILYWLFFNNTRTEFESEIALCKPHET